MKSAKYGMRNLEWRRYALSLSATQRSSAAPQAKMADLRHKSLADPSKAFWRTYSGGRGSARDGSSEFIRTVPDEAEVRHTAKQCRSAGKALANSSRRIRHAVWRTISEFRDCGACSEAARLLRSLRRTDRPAPEDQAAVRRSTNRRSLAMTAEESPSGFLAIPFMDFIP